MSARPLFGLGSELVAAARTGVLTAGVRRPTAASAFVEKGQKALAYLGRMIRAAAAIRTPAMESCFLKVMVTRELHPFFRIQKWLTYQVHKPFLAYFRIRDTVSIAK